MVVVRVCLLVCAVGCSKKEKAMMEGAEQALDWRGFPSAEEVCASE